MRPGVGGPRCAKGVGTAAGPGAPSTYGYKTPLCHVILCGTPRPRYTQPQSTLVRARSLTPLAPHSRALAARQELDTTPARPREAIDRRHPPGTGGAVREATATWANACAWLP